MNFIYKEAARVVALENTADESMRDPLKSELGPEYLKGVAHAEAFDSGPEGEVPVSCLKLVNIVNNRKRRLLVNRYLFLEIFRIFSLDEYAPYLYRSKTPRLHVLDCKRPYTDGGPPMLRFYLGCPEYSIIWSYHPATRATQAIMITENEWDAGLLIRAIVAKQDDSTMFNPLFLPFVSCFQEYTNRWDQFETTEPTPEVERDEHDRDCTQASQRERNLGPGRPECDDRDQRRRRQY
ncbi:hypothetical protein B0T22DRAFT_443363 [Podospora appendiculata]|uniref:Uncharacterized protein n=1 Tax=Podospora appendiculata TaxID=314037 RepID=A0AAE0X254_9PEZI|nr:hypothetical protein B0T22DRAFT_443363 [Podospora appendiculata]